MAKTRQQKEDSVQQLVDRLGRMKSVVFTSFSGLTVADATMLRKSLRDSQIDYVVTKKSLLRRGLKDLQLDPAIADSFAGAAALAFGYEDEVMPAKLLAKFAKSNEAVSLLGGIVNGTYLDQKQIVALAALPGKEEMIAKTVWTIKAPLTGFVNVLAGNLRGLVTVLQAIRDAKPA